MQQSSVNMTRSRFRSTNGLNDRHQQSHQILRQRSADRLPSFPAPFQPRRSQECDPSTRSPIRTLTFCFSPCYNCNRCFQRSRQISPFSLTREFSRCSRKIEHAQCSAGCAGHCCNCSTGLTEPEWTIPAISNQCAAFNKQISAAFSLLFDQNIRKP